MKERWKELGVKDKIQYIMAIVLIASGIIMAFLSFFLNAYTIAGGTLIYISQCFIMAGGIFGISVYFRNKLGEFQSSAADKIEQIVKKILEDRDSKAE